MADMTFTWHGASGKQYEYWVYEIGASFKNEAGNYIFAKRNTAGKWTPVYIGETKSLKERLTSNHEKLPCVKKYGGTHIHAHTTPAGEQARKAEEADMIAKWDPPCNKE